MRNCNNCANAFYTGGQEGHASKKGVAVETLKYKYCVLLRWYVDKNDNCSNFQENEQNDKKGIDNAKNQSFEN